MKTIFEQQIQPLGDHQLIYRVLVKGAEMTCLQRAAHWLEVARRVQGPEANKILGAFIDRLVPMADAGPIRDDLQDASHFYGRGNYEGALYSVLRGLHKAGMTEARQGFSILIPRVWG